VSTFLAGVRRSTGITYVYQPYGRSSARTGPQLTNIGRPSLRSDSISSSPEVKKWIESYLGVGEWMMDQSVAVMGSSGYFERKR